MPFYNLWIPAFAGMTMVGSDCLGNNKNYVHPTFLINNKSFISCSPAWHPLSLGRYR